MTTPKLIQCPDSYWRHAIYGLGLYIADYPLQVFLAGIVQNWCPKYVTILHYSPTANLFEYDRCEAKPDNLDVPGSC